MITGVKWSILPFIADVLAPDEESCRLRLVRQGAEFHTSVEFETEGEPRRFDALPPEALYLTRVKALHFEMVLTPDHRLNKKMAPQNRDIFNLVRDETSLALRSIRVFAFSPLVQELKVQDKHSDSWLYRWCVNISTDELDWAPVIPLPAGLQGIIEMGEYFSSVEEHPLVLAKLWPFVEEAFDHAREPYTEQTLVMNAAEAARTGRAKWALLEAVMAVEVATTRFLKMHYVSIMKWRESQVKDLLNAQLTLRHRLTGLIPLILPPGDLQAYRLDTVLRAVTLRNRVVHELGDLPNGISEDDLRDLVAAATAFALYLLKRAGDHGEDFFAHLRVAEQQDI